MKSNPTIIPPLYLKSFYLLCFCLVIMGCKKSNPSSDTIGKTIKKDTLVIEIPDLQNQSVDDEDTIRKTLHLIETNSSGLDMAKITDGNTTIFMKYNYITRQPEVTIAHKE